jgi:aspartate racemase
MKLLGIVGGTGPESTIEYYRAIIAAYRAQVTDGSYPRLLISSVDVKNVLGLAAANELPHGRSAATVVRSGPKAKRLKKRK